MENFLSNTLSKICITMNNFSTSVAVIQAFFFALFLAIGIIPIIQSIQECCCKKDHSCKEQPIDAKTNCEKVKNCLKENLKEGINSIVQTVFDKFLEKSTCACTCSGERFYTVSGYKAPQCYTTVLFLVLLLLIPTAILQFCDLFFFEQALGCTVNNLACCYDKEQKIPQRLNCSNTSYLEDNNITSVICYRFTLRPGISIGSALGIISLIGFFISIVNVVLLKCSNGNKTICWRAACTLVIQFVAVLIALGVTIGMCVYYQKHTHPIKAKFRITQVYPAGITLIIYILIFPWWQFEKLGDKKNEDNITNERQRLLNEVT